MRQGYRNTEKQKKIARLKYKERQVEKHIKWAINRGFLRWNELIEIHKKYNIEVYGYKWNDVCTPRKKKD